MLGGANNSFEIYDNTVVNLSPFMLTYTKRAADNMSPKFFKNFYAYANKWSGGFL